MDINVKAKNCDVPARVKEEAIGKIQHATRFFDRLQGVEVVFSAEQNPRIPEPASVEITARAKGGRTTHHIRAEGLGADHRGAVDAAVSRFERQLASYKARLVDRRKRAGAAAGPNGGGQRGAGAGEQPAEHAADEDDQDGPGAQIVRTKQFELQPMLPEDAAWQLELLGHDFYVFTNAGSGQCNVLYRRRDGNLGLIEAV